MLEELERALPWAQDNMPPSIVRWMLEALLQGTPDVKRPDDVNNLDYSIWRRSATYYLLSSDEVKYSTPGQMDMLKRSWVGTYRLSLQAEEIRNYKQYEKKKTDE